MSFYFRPIIQTDAVRPSTHYSVGGQKQWFDKVEIINRGEKPTIAAADKVPSDILNEITRVKANNHFKSFSKPLIMGILNVTPDSFSDGGKNLELKNAMKTAQRMIVDGADIIDIGGESTRPGAKAISAEDELNRIEPLIRYLKNEFPQINISVDTRKASVMARVMELGVDFINDVSAMSFDKNSRNVLARKKAQVCLMHGGLNPEKMQENTFYNNILLDIYDYLKARIDFAISGGVKKENILIDPGIGFGKTTTQNVLLIRKASLFHGLGCPLLYGISRKSFIGEVGKTRKPVNRFPGSIAGAIELVRQGIQVIRVHDVKKTRQALDVWETLISF